MKKLKVEIVRPQPKKVVKPVKVIRILPAGKGRIICLVALAGVMSACSGTAFNGDEFRLSGTPEGIRAFTDWQIGQANEAKASPDVKSSHYQLQEEKTKLMFKILGGAK